MPALATVTALAIAREFLPDLAARLVGPRREDVAREIVGLATDVLGKPVAREEPAQVIAEIAADPAAADALRLELRALEVREFEAAASDRASARLLATPDDRRMRLGFIVGAFLLLLLTLAGVVYIEGWELPSQQGIILLATIAGASFKSLSDIGAYYFGSSAGSRDKDMVIAKQIDVAAEERASSAPPARPEPNPAPSTAPVVDTPAPAPAARTRDLVGEIMAMEVAA